MDSLISDTLKSKFFYAVISRKSKHLPRLRDLKFEIISGQAPSMPRPIVWKIEHSIFPTE
jgi:hypothetical protein